MDLEIIQRRIEQLDKASNELRLIKTTLDDALKEDAKYQEVDLQLRELTIQKKKIRSDIWSLPAYQKNQAKIREIKEEIADLNDILDHELLQWRQENASDEIVGIDGTTRKLKVKVRLQPQRSRP